MSTTAMRVEFINPFIGATKRVFETMIGVTVDRGLPYLRRQGETHEGLIGVIGLTGGAIGIAAICVCNDAAINICERFIGTRPAEVDAEVIDAVGELINMIAGNAKSQLETYELSISLPSIIRGREQAIAFPQQINPICIPFSSPIGNFIIQIGFSVPTA